MGDGMYMDQHIHSRRQPFSESSMGHEDTHIDGGSSSGATILGLGDLGVLELELEQEELSDS